MPSEQEIKAPRRLLRRLLRGVRRFFADFFHYLCCVSIEWYIVFWCRRKSYGNEHLEFPGGAIIAANHTSYLDPAAIGISCPDRFHYLAREDLFEVPLLSEFIRRCNTHPIRGSSSLASIRLATRLLQEGKKVVIFPEGRRSDDGALQPIQRGVGVIVTLVQCAIIPCYIHGTYEVWGRHRRFPRLRGNIVTVYGKPIAWEEFSHLDRKEAQVVISRRVSQAVADLKAWYEELAAKTKD